MTTDPVLAVLLDPQRRLDLLGAKVSVTRLRHKPGVSTSAALVADGEPFGWIRVLTGGARAKADKIHMRAQELGFADLVSQSPLAEDMLVLWGPLVTDPELGQHLAELELGDGSKVLRYNPLRRLVIRDGDVVHRITAERHRTRLTQLTHALEDARIPVVVPVTDEALGSRRITTWPWIHGHDAGEASTPEQRRQVGELLARLHAVRPDHLPDLPARTWDDVVAGAEATVASLDMVPELFERATTALSALRETPPAASTRLVVSHGDFSLDQCLVTTAGDVLLTDFDRATLAPAELDFAILVATELAAGRTWWRDVLAGHGDAEVTPEWVAAVLLSRITEPWRAQTADWQEETARRLTVVESLLLPLHVPHEVSRGDDFVTVARAWPSLRHGLPEVTFEGTDALGRLRAGTWEPGGQTKLMPAGRDKKLPGLGELAARGDVVVHRVGRRAVVRLPEGFAKVVRPGRAAKVAVAAESGARLARVAGMVAPAVVEATDDVVLFEVAAGASLHEDSADPRAWDVFAEVWSRFQGLGVGGLDLPVHTGADEAAMLRTWAARTEAFLSGTGWTERLHAVAERLDAAPVARLVSTHRDLHDKQLLWDGEHLAVLDMDTVCLADPALDPANLAVHASLRHMQGVWTEEHAGHVASVARAVAGAAGVTDGQWRLAELATVVRLAAVYVTRPQWRERVLEWADAHWNRLA